MDRTNGRLDAAVIAFRDCPSAANAAALMQVQADHARAFLAEQTGEFQDRTRTDITDDDRKD